MRNPVRGAQFRRDVKLAQKRGKDMAKLRAKLISLWPCETFPNFAHSIQCRMPSGRIFQISRAGFETLG